MHVHSIILTQRRQAGNVARTSTVVPTSSGKFLRFPSDQLQFSSRAPLGQGTGRPVCWGNRNSEPVHVWSSKHALPDRACRLLSSCSCECRRRRKEKKGAPNDGETHEMTRRPCMPKFGSTACMQGDAGASHLQVSASLPGPQAGAVLAAV
jgi:hypothetical protein